MHFVVLYFMCNVAVTNRTRRIHRACPRNSLTQNPCSNPSMQFSHFQDGLNVTDIYGGPEVQNVRTFQKTKYYLQCEMSFSEV